MRRAWPTVVVFALLGCAGTTTSAPVSAYPPHAPLSTTRDDIPAWLEEPQRWAVGDYLVWHDDGIALLGHEGEWKLRLVARAADGSEWWESSEWSEESPRRITALIVEVGPRDRRLRAAYEGAPGEVGAPIDRSLAGSSRAYIAIYTGFDLLQLGIIPGKADFEEAPELENDDVEIEERTVYTLRLKFYQAIGPGEAVGKIWVSPSVPGKTVRVSADGYVFLIPVFSQEAGVTSFGHEEHPQPELRLPEGSF